MVFITWGTLSQTWTHDSGIGLTPNPNSVEEIREKKLHACASTLYYFFLL